MKIRFRPQKQAAVEQSKVFLKFLNFKKPTTCFSPKLNFGEKHVVGFFKFKNFKNTFDCSTAGNPKIGPIFGVSCLTYLHCNSTKLIFFAFICKFIHCMTHTKCQKHILWPNSSHLKIGVNGAPAYSIPRSVSQSTSLF